MRGSNGTKTLLAALVVAGLGTAAVAMPGKHWPPTEELLQKYDTNKNGILDETEREAMRKEHEARRAERKAEMLRTFDKNGDGQLDDAERKAMHQQRLAERFKALDKNNSGTLSLEEYQAGPEGKGHGRRGGSRF